MIRLLLIACLILATLGLISTILSNCGCTNNPIPKALPHDTPVKTDPKAIILNQLRQVNELTTSVMGIVAIISSQQTKEMVGMEIGSTEMLYMGVGKIRAGIDLGELTEEDIRLDRETVYVTLPEVQILDVSLDVNQSQVLNVDRSLLLSPWGHDIQSAAEKRALEEIQLAASNEEWVSKSVAEQTMAVLDGMAKMMGVEELRIQWDLRVEKG